ncbi:hypothetical protein BJ684DRAFT_20469 [Piptocephalis cylindrospora]|uniref:rhomboid protease n=1 Tax=Piptocephalis cylindrospora TaxID=1907219 RepID=A0A4P9Y2B7_9FUNG|nr:hypothetical protein BJ684DRAFT_20469 [Piptocephalis cylindrospora]|eukprot:RKP13018.1 hypothetical protein BJ684DRAFT_20469 [Piptocephalis cylindrospora]
MSSPNIHRLGDHQNYQASSPPAASSYFSSFRQQMSDYVRRLPLISITLPSTLFAVFLLSCFLPLIPGLDGLDLPILLGLWPRRIIQNKEIWRIFSYPWVHANLPHVLFNILALTPLIQSFERSNGTLKTLWLFLILPYTLFPAVLYLGAAYGLLPVLIDSVVVGASGWFFSMLVWQSYRVPHFSVFGFFQVSSHLYPLFLLLILSILIPSSSFWGHVAGWAVGHLHGYGALGWCIPRGYYFERIEGWSLLERQIVHSSRWVKAEVDGGLWLPVSADGTGPGVGGSASYGSAFGQSLLGNPSGPPGHAPSAFPGHGQRLGDTL